MGESFGKTKAKGKDFFRKPKPKQLALFKQLPEARVCDAPGCYSEGRFGFNAFKAKGQYYCNQHRHLGEKQ